jgi:RNA polymerase sigma-70 factor (ECF subfamily)
MQTQAFDGPSAYEIGRNAWPGVALDEAAFVRRASELGISPELATSRAGDLYLAWACAARDPVGLAHFDRQYLGRIDVYVAGLRMSSDALDELRQQLRIRLLVGEPPRIGQYGGRGPLSAWVRTCAVRLGLNLCSDVKARVSSMARDIEAVDALVGESVGPEVATLRNRYGAAFKAGLERSLGALEPREKTILRMHLVDNLNIEAIGQVYRVHRATVARWLVAIRKRILLNLWSELQADLPATISECQSILSAVKNDLDISWKSMLGAGEHAPAT